MSGLSRAYKRRPKGLPLSIPGLQLWLDASDASTLFQDSAGTTPASADGDPVGCWKDKSGNGRHVTQADGTKKPLRKDAKQNGRAAIEFDGANDRLIRASTFTLAQPFSIFLVAKKYSFTTAGAFIDSYDDVQCVIYIGASYDNPGYLNLTAGAPPLVKIATPLYTSLIHGIFNGSSSKISVNNGSFISDNGGTNSLTGISIGDIRKDPPYSGYALDGYFCEIIIYNSELSADNKNMMSSYLNAKWSIY